ncbi:MAG: hypothetical protein NT096_01175 [Proteobacteria bacterium]|nr:hypothetical protein [Pseudomonadota bacterium]
MRGGQISLQEGQPPSIPPAEKNRFGSLTPLGAFNSDRDTYIISHGWNRADSTADCDMDGIPDDQDIPCWEEDMGAAIKQITGANVLLWNWQEQAKSSCSWGNYRVVCAPRTKVPTSGKYLAESIQENIPAPADYNKDIHMIGHSLGAMVIVVAAKEITANLRDNIKSLTLLDAPLTSSDLNDEDFLKENRDIFVDNYISQYSRSLDVADTNVNLTRSYESRDCVDSDKWYSVDKADTHGYAYVWYYSSISNFANQYILCDASIPSSLAVGGFNFLNYHDNIVKDYVQQTNLSRWEIIPLEIYIQGGIKCIDEGNFYCNEEPSDAQAINDYAYNNVLNITVEKAYTFKSSNDASAFYTNKTGNAIYDGQTGTIKLITHSDAIVYTEITIPNDVTSLRFSYEFLNQTTNGILDAFIDDVPVFTAYSEDDYGSKKNSYWIDITSFAGQTVSLTFRLSNPDDTQPGEINLDNILFAQILPANSEETLIQLSSFTANPSDRKVILTWSTASEIDNAGFNLYRAESTDSEYIKINSSLIPAQGSPTSGSTYNYIDNNVQNRKTYYYKIEDIDLNGVSTLHGPVSATPRVIHNLR